MIPSEFNLLEGPFWDSSCVRMMSPHLHLERFIRTATTVTIGDANFETSDLTPYTTIFSKMEMDFFQHFEAGTKTRKHGGIFVSGSFSGWKLDLMSPLTEVVENEGMFSPRKKPQPNIWGWWNHHVEIANSSNFISNWSVQTWWHIKFTQTQGWFRKNPSVQPETACEWANGCLVWWLTLLVHYHTSRNLLRKGFLLIGDMARIGLTTKHLITKPTNHW